MNKDFIWIDESYDQNCINGNKFYVLCAIKITATPSQIFTTYSKSGMTKCETHHHIYNAHEAIRNKIKAINRGTKSKGKLLVNELHENKLVSNKKTRRIKTLFLKELFESDPNTNLGIYYVYYNFKDDDIINNKELYQNMAKELLNLCTTLEEATIILDICLDKFSTSTEHKDIIDFLKKECHIKKQDFIHFDDSQSNYGLQAVDNVVGTIRRFLHQQADNKENYEIIKDYIVLSADIGLKYETAVNT
ncbi:DUF3800 domain-containing protein [Lachnospiraceae bacterium 50-23]